MKKRIVSILLTLCMVLMLCPVTALADEPPCIRGDIDFDGEVTVTDAVCLQNYLEGLESFENFPEGVFIVADYNGDGSVDYSDWIGLQSYFENDLELPVSNITVTNGKATACGTEIRKAAKGTRVTLTADSPSDDMVFDKWIVNEGGVTLADENSATTTFTMPAGPVSVTAMYKQKYTLAITLDGFQVGNTPADCTVTFDSTIPGVTFSEDDIRHVFCWKYLSINGEEQVQEFSSTNVFQAGTRYRVLISLDNKDLRELPAITLNGNTVKNCELAYKGEKPNVIPYAINILYELGTPAGQQYTIIYDGGEDSNPITGATTSPQTGDNSHMALWIALLFVSGGLLTATVIKGAETEQKRRKRHE